MKPLLTPALRALSLAAYCGQSDVSGSHPTGKAQDCRGGNTQCGRPGEEAQTDPLLGNGRVFWQRPLQCFHPGIPLSWRVLHPLHGSSAGQAPSPVVDTGTTNADDTTLVGLEAIWSRGSLGVTSEIIGSRVDEEDAGGASHLWGGYASVQNILTGQVLPFDSSVGTFRSIKPRRPFTLGKGGRGPGKSARGFSTLDLNDGPVRGGKMVILKGGLNWHWNKHTMWMLNLGVAEPRTATENGYVLIGRARFKVRY